jgi:hypothetical protein
MAELQIDGGELVLHLTKVEKAEAVHGDLRVPLSAVQGVDILEDAYEPAGVTAGMKIGMRVPGSTAVATIIRPGHKIFAAVHRDTARGVRVRLDGATWEAWIVGCLDPEAVAEQVTAATRQA